jgi:1-aminocyclopropane-1-carboxylate deaminase/D-cysteine desulfhydrase-like pyridoxal-dependent ACC family enzyme
MRGFSFFNMLSVTPSPLQLLHEPLFEAKGVAVYLKRDDLLHRYVQGNKWRKLKYNLQQAVLNGHATLLTFGGPYSNHIYATAAAARMFNFRSIGIIRGEEPENKSPTLQFAAEQGMELCFLNREDYRLMSHWENAESLRARFGNFYPVPEGGTNMFALQGAAEIVEEIDIPFDFITTAVGTGGTLAGLVAGLKGNKQVIGFSSLKGADTLTETVNKLVEQYSAECYNNFQLNFHYTFGGYAKVKPELIEFIKNFRAMHQIMLEPVYTGKMMFGLYDLIDKNHFAKGSTIVALHTGGLQGLCGFKDYLLGWSSEYFS